MGGGRKNARPPSTSWKIQTTSRVRCLVLGRYLFGGNRRMVRARFARSHARIVGRQSRRIPGPPTTCDGSSRTGVIDRLRYNLQRLISKTLSCLTLAVLVVWIFHGVLGEGGCFYAPPHLTQLLSYVATCSRQRLKARPKSPRKYFGHF